MLVRDSDFVSSLQVNLFTVCQLKFWFDRAGIDIDQRKPTEISDFARRLRQSVRKVSYNLEGAVKSLAALIFELNGGKCHLSNRSRQIDLSLPALIESLSKQVPLIDEVLATLDELNVDKKPVLGQRVSSVREALSLLKPSVVDLLFKIEDKEAEVEWPNLFPSSLVRRGYTASGGDYRASSSRGEWYRSEGTGSSEEQRRSRYSGGDDERERRRQSRSSVDEPSRSRYSGGDDERKRRRQSRSSVDEPSRSRYSGGGDERERRRQSRSSVDEPSRSRYSGGDDERERRRQSRSSVDEPSRSRYSSGDDGKRRRGEDRKVPYGRGVSKHSGEKLPYFDHRDNRNYTSNYGGGPFPGSPGLFAPYSTTFPQDFSFYGAFPAAYPYGYFGPPPMWNQPARPSYHKQGNRASGPATYSRGLSRFSSSQGDSSSSGANSPVTRVVSDASKILLNDKAISSVVTPTNNLNHSLGSCKSPVALIGESGSVMLEKEAAIKKQERLGKCETVSFGPSREVMLKTIRKAFGDINMSIDDLLTLEFATDKQLYDYWLQQCDIACAGRLYYRLADREGHTFEVLSPELCGIRLRNELSRFMENKKQQRFTIIIALNSIHWVTLVIERQNENYLACYADSFGVDAPSSITDVVRNVLGANVDIRSVSCLQQKDSYNCGLWALENARSINQVLDANLGKRGPDVLNAMRNSLTLNVPGLDNIVDKNSLRGSMYFQSLRIDISQLLRDNPQDDLKLEVYTKNKALIDTLLTLYIESGYYALREGPGLEDIPPSLNGDDLSDFVDKPHSGLESPKASSVSDFSRDKVGR